MFNLFKKNKREKVIEDLISIKKARKEELEQEIFYNIRKLYGNEITLNEALKELEHDIKDPELLSLEKVVRLFKLKNIVDEYMNILEDLKNDSI